MPEQLTHPTYGVIAPGSDPATKPVGTGPFRFVEYVKDQRLVVERNADYWGRIWGTRDSVQGFKPHPSSTNQDFTAIGLAR